MVRPGKVGINSAIAAVGMVVLLVVGVAAGYYLGGMGMSASATTKKVTSTVQGSGGGVQTVTSTETVSVSGPGTSTGTTSTGTTSSSTASTSANTTSSNNPANNATNGISTTLINAAKAEGGSLTIYTTTNMATMNTRVANFQKLYPWAQVTVLVLGPPDIYSRAVAEAKTGNHIADILGAAADDFVSYQQAGLLSNFSSPLWPLEGWPAPGPIIDPIIQQAYGVVINTQQVPTSQVPKNWTDLANPYWKGKIATDTAAQLGATGTDFVGLYSYLGNASWTQLMHGIAANNPTNFGSGSLEENAVVTGQKAIAIGMPPSAFAGDVAKGAPLQWVWLNPQFSHYSCEGIVKNAPHPLMAELWETWVTSVIGQSKIQGAGAVSLIPSVAHSNSTLLPPGITMIPVTDSVINSAHWTKVLSGIFGNATG